MIRDERKVYAIMLKALREIANLAGGRIERETEAGLIARSALRQIDEDWRDPTHTPEGDEIYNYMVRPRE